MKNLLVWLTNRINTHIHQELEQTIQDYEYSLINHRLAEISAKYDADKVAAQLEFLIAYQESHDQKTLSNPR